MIGSLALPAYAASWVFKALNSLLLSLPSLRKQQYKCVLVLLKSQIKHGEDRANLSFLPFFPSVLLPLVHG